MAGYVSGLKKKDENDPKDLQDKKYRGTGRRNP